MAKKVSDFKDVRDRMKNHSGQGLQQMLTDMGISRRHYNRCLGKNQIPYKGLVDWCMKNDAKLDEILLEEK